MSEIEISNIDADKNTFHFTISGNNDYGLDKSIVNAIRRTLLNDIPTVAFETDDNVKNKDILMITNNTSLHNEMLLHRISLLPLYLNPENFMKHYLFECHVKHTSHNPFQFVTANDIQIYPLKKHIQERIENLNDESKISNKEQELFLLNDLLKDNNPDNYQLNNELNQKKKDEILKPFEFRGNKNYCLLTELKNSNSEGMSQELHFYGSPSVKIGKDHARYQAVSCATYSFVKNEELIQQTIQDKIKLEDIQEDDIDEFTTKFMLRESERYFHRDKFNEPNQYNFTIKSAHYYDSPTLFKKSLEILIEQCDLLKLSFLHLLQEKDSVISVDNPNEFVYHYTINNYCHTIGNLIQSHIVRRSIDEKSILHMCGYKKTHPLEESIKLILSLNHKHKIAKKNEIQKFQAVTTFLMEQLDEIMNELKIILKATDKSF